jgi:hypothetical protein
MPKTNGKAKGDLGQVPAGERDLVSGKPNGKAPVKKLLLTSRAKMGKAKPAAKKPASAKQQIKETVAEVQAANEKAHERRVEACGKAAAQAPDVKAAALRVRLTNRTIKLVGCDFTSLQGVTPEAAQRYAEMLAAGNVTPRAAETTPG